MKMQNVCRIIALNVLLGSTVVMATETTKEKQVWYKERRNQVAVGAASVTALSAATILYLYKTGVITKESMVTLLKENPVTRGVNFGVDKTTKGINAVANVSKKGLDAVTGACTKSATFVKDSVVATTKAVVALPGQTVRAVAAVPGKVAGASKSAFNATKNIVTRTPKVS